MAVDQDLGEIGHLSNVPTPRRRARGAALVATKSIRARGGEGYSAGDRLAEAVAVSFDLETCKIVTLSDAALTEADARVIAGLTL
jgi:hypothetical protein